MSATDYCNGLGTGSIPPFTTKLSADQILFYANQSMTSYTEQSKSNFRHLIYTQDGMHEIGKGGGSSPQKINLGETRATKAA